MKFRRVLAQILGEVPGGSGADAEVRVRKVPEDSGAEVRSGSGRFRCRLSGQDPEGSGRRSVRVRKVPVQIPR